MDSEGYFIGGVIGAGALASLGAGFFRGYLHSKGASIETQVIDDAIMYGPAVAQGCVGAMGAGLLGLMIGRDYSPILTLPISAVIGFAAGAAIGGLETAAGYGIADYIIR